MDLRLQHRQVAKILGVAEKTLRHWEYRGVLPRVALMPSIREFLGPLYQDPVPSDLRSRLRAWRRAHGLTQVQAAKRLGVGRRAIQCIEQHPNHRPWARTLRILEEGLSS